MRQWQQHGNGEDGDKRLVHGRETESYLPKHFVILNFDLERQIPAAYIPKLMMEMLCVRNSVNLDYNNLPTGASSLPICASAIMVRQTGAIL